MTEMIPQLLEFVRDTYQSSDFIPLHVPTFQGNEQKYVLDTIESTFVSSVGKYVDEFENKLADYTGVEKAIAVVNGTAALHTALTLVGVERGDVVITQALTFVATCNAIHQLGAEPLFIDVCEKTLGLCPRALSEFLAEKACLDSDGNCCLKATNQKIRAVVPMHTFGHPVDLDRLLLIAAEWNLDVVEDAAESLGSYYKGRHTGTFGRFGAISFNGNKIITTGGGGILLSQSVDDAKRAKHITTTAKVPHPYEYFHDEPAFNYRMPNINAALGCAQFERLTDVLANKRKLASLYRDFFNNTPLQFIDEPEGCSSNFWLNAVRCNDRCERNELLEKTNAAGVMTRPIWTLMHRLPMFTACKRGDLPVSEKLENTVVNIPSSPVAEIKLESH
ncbi:LegC family aminotransferase [Marinagarivorans algicola]|uniref:LegC family aminotransferase n=1 Tax=Marinagarivorans algicola TaxID=1513270 RepID=UPI000A4660CA|nr:LegC family aminotransferase [Marinagarivorans algicola]